MTNHRHGKAASRNDRQPRKALILLDVGITARKALAYPALTRTPIQRDAHPPRQRSVHSNPRTRRVGRKPVPFQVPEGWHGSVVVSFNRKSGARDGACEIDIADESVTANKVYLSQRQNIRTVRSDSGKL